MNGAHRMNPSDFLPNPELSSAVTAALIFLALTEIFLNFWMGWHECHLIPSCLAIRHFIYRPSFCEAQRVSQMTDQGVAQRSTWNHP